MRAFIAVNLCPAVQNELDKIYSDLQKAIPRGAVRWVQVKNIHLTLKFLGDVPVEKLDELKVNLAAVGSRHSRFEFEIAGSGCFPSITRPRVIWIGVITSPQLSKLQQDLEKTVEKLGFPRENRLFSPHLTLGRVSNGVSPGQLKLVSEAMGALKVESLGICQALEIHLYKSDLQPGGAIYTPLYIARLSGKEE